MARIPTGARHHTHPCCDHRVGPHQVVHRIRAAELEGLRDEELEELDRDAEQADDAEDDREDGDDGDGRRPPRAGRWVAELAVAQGMGRFAVREWRGIGSLWFPMTYALTPTRLRISDCGFRIENGVRLTPSLLIRNPNSAIRNLCRPRPRGAADLLAPLPAARTIRRFMFRHVPNALTGGRLPAGGGLLRAARRSTSTRAAATRGCSTARSSSTSSPW